ncbi:MAG: malate dehydrogenase [Euryarchaeota archaeon]|nr:malate dehydrogenase [Euryarchaeota archaeon]
MKVSIIGGAGRVGSAAAYSLVMQGLVDELYLLDIAGERAAGEALDITHALSGLGRDVSVEGGDDYSGIAGSDVVIVTAGVPRKPGMSRLDLRHQNVGIIREIARKVAKACDDALLFVVSNPVDVLTYYAWKESGLGRERVFGLGTLLDTLRLKSMLKKRLGVDYREESYVFGEHGDSMLPVFRLRHNHPRDELLGVFEEVRQGAARVIAWKGATWFAPAVAIARVVEAIGRGGVLPVSTFIEEYGLYLGHLAEISRSGVRRAEFELTEEEARLFQRSAEVVRRAIEDV